MKTRLKRPSGQAAIYGHAVRAIVQILLATGRTYTLETLREKLREFYREEGDYERRAVASLSTVELVGALLSASPTLEKVGLQIRLTNGVAQLTTARVGNVKLARFIAEHGRPPESELTPTTLEVLSCVALKGPLTQAEIDRYFGETDKRHAVATLRQMGLIEEFAGPDARLRFAHTEKFLLQFKLNSIEEFRSALAAAQS